MFFKTLFLVLCIALASCRRSHLEEKAPLKKIKIKAFLTLDSNLTIKNELLNEFYALKIFEYTEKLNTINIPEMRITFEDTIKIVKLNEGNQAYAIGSTLCNLENYSILNVSSPICPWHWAITKREDRYPFRRAFAKCNCKSCQAKTIYDSDMFRLSNCRPETILQPVLIKISTENHTDKWTFGLEEVAFACVCGIRLSPH